VRGRIELFSLDTLVDMLTRAGIRVELLLGPGTGRQAEPSRPRRGLTGM